MLMKSHRNDLFSKPERAFKQPSLLSLNGREWSVARLSTDMIHYSIFIEKSCQSSFLQRFSEQKFHRFLPSKIAALLAAAKVGLETSQDVSYKRKIPPASLTGYKWGPQKSWLFWGKGGETSEKRTFLTQALFGQQAWPKFCLRQNRFGCRQVSLFSRKTKKEIGAKRTLLRRGSPNWARTSDIMINSHALYRLSYGGI